MDNPCSRCNRRSGCTYKTMVICEIIGDDYKNVEYERVPFESSEDPDRCPVCYAVSRRYHHINCPMEECPKCRKQLRTCNCSVQYILTPPTRNIDEVSEMIKDDELSSHVNKVIYERTGHVPKPDRNLYNMGWDLGKKIRLFDSLNNTSEYLIAYKFDVR